MDHLLCLVIDDNGSTGLPVHVPRRTVPGIYAIWRRELLTVGNRIVDLLRCPIPLLQLILPFLSGLIVA
jgi:hypothetical protein